jgi:sugar phosphate isomerase/epimerase
MLKAVSTYVVVKQRLHAGLLDRFARAGAQAIEIFGARGHFDYTDRGHVREIAQWFAGAGVSFNSLHAPIHSDAEWGRSGAPPVNIADREKRRRIESMDEIKRALEVAEQAPFRFLIQHIGNSGESFTPQGFEAAMSSVEHLRAFAKPLGVTVLVENIPNELATPERLMELLTIAHFDDVGICFDFGHAHVMSTVEQAFEVLRDRIRSTHVHDNHGERDAHLWPGDGAIDWPAAMRLLRSAPEAPPLLLEVEGDEKTDAASKLPETFQKLDGAS